MFQDQDDNVFIDNDDHHLVEITDVDADNYTPEMFDAYLTALVLLSCGGELLRVQVAGQKRDANGNSVGQAHSNPILDTCEYEAEFTDGSREIYMANLIAENMYSQVDEEGQQYTLLNEIIDHKSDGKALSKDDGFYLDCYGKQQTRMITQG